MKKIKLLPNILFKYFFSIFRILSTPHTCPSPIKEATPPAKIVVITPKLSPSPKKVTKMAATSSPKKNRNVIVLPKSSRREVKVPLKYREEETKTVTPNKIKTSTTPQSKKVARSPSSSVLINEKTPEKDTVSPNNTRN